MLGEVTVVETGDGRVPEDERDTYLAADRVHRDEPARRVMKQHVVGLLGRLTERRGGHIDPEVADELAVGAESEAPRRRVHSIGPDDKVEPTGRAAFEADEAP
jgi:hypothetical protein